MSTNSESQTKNFKITVDGVSCFFQFCRNFSLQHLYFSSLHMAHMGLHGVFSLPASVSTKLLGFNYLNFDETSFMISILSFGAYTP